jgi:hypothetical protein
VRWVDAGREKADGRTLLVRNIGYATRTEEVREKFQARFPQSITLFTLAVPLLPPRAVVTHLSLTQDYGKILDVYLPNGPLPPST